MKYVYAIIFDANRYRGILGNKVYARECDAQTMLKGLIEDHPDIFNHDDYTVECLVVEV